MVVNRVSSSCSFSGSLEIGNVDPGLDQRGLLVDIQLGDGIGEAEDGADHGADRAVAENLEVAGHVRRHALEIERQADALVLAAGFLFQRLAHVFVDGRLLRRVDGRRILAVAGEIEALNQFSRKRSSVLRLAGLSGSSMPPSSMVRTTCLEGRSPSKPVARMAYWEDLVVAQEIVDRPHRLDVLHVILGVFRHHRIVDRHAVGHGFEQVILHGALLRGVVDGGVGAVPGRN